MHSINIVVLYVAVKNTFYDKYVGYDNKPQLVFE